MCSLLGPVAPNIGGHLTGVKDGRSLTGIDCTKIGSDYKWRARREKLQTPFGRSSPDGSSCLNPIPVPAARPSTVVNNLGQGPPLFAREHAKPTREQAATEIFPSAAFHGGDFSTPAAGRNPLSFIMLACKRSHWSSRLP